MASTEQSSKQHEPQIGDIVTGTDHTIFPYQDGEYKIVGFRELYGIPHYKLKIIKPSQRAQQENLPFNTIDSVEESLFYYDQTKTSFWFVFKERPPERRSIKRINQIEIG